MARKRPTDADRVEALQRLLSGLARDDDVPDLTDAIAELHPAHDTFPGEVFMHLAADILEIADVDRDDPIPHEGLCEAYLPECEFRGRENRRIQYAILTSAAARAGLEPDLLDEVVWWQTDDYWRYALCAAVALIRACAQRRGIPVAQLVGQLAKRHGLTLT